MNRYRNIPGRGPSKATASTLCQKCLKRGHYSYECKVTTQERPYLSRPSRTQQLLNPKLRPQLTTDVPDSTEQTKGTADALLAQREQERGRKRDLDELDPLEALPRASKRNRSLSSASASSVSTISTNRSRSESPRREGYEEQRRGGRTRSQASHHSWSRKRRYSDSSSDYSVSSYPSRRTPERNIRRRRRESSPKERGRPRDVSRDGDRRDRSRSRRIDKGRPARARRSITPGETNLERSYARRPSPRIQPNGPHNDNGRQHERNRPAPPQRERSLSPYSRRLALTQAMNMGR
ncbi:zinc knuckle-domain-containing protein [Aspergillus egyptiacus]|nr:zinc knuckle-domain-containing protein [Aspergillus egyptiacus]